MDEPEPVDSVLKFLSGYDTLEYSWVKATVVSMRLWILFVMLQNTNNAAVHSMNLGPCGEYLERCKPKTVNKLFEIMQQYYKSNHGKRQKFE